MALRKLAFDAAALSAARATQIMLSFLALPLLARLLGPADFGLVALAMSFVMFTMTLSDAGIGLSLVRTPAHDTVAWSSAFWMITALSGLLSLFLLAIAWPAAWLFNQPHLAYLVAALAPLPLVQGMLSPPLADLQQREKFRHLALAEIMGAVSGITTAIVVAISGGGAWALVGQQLAYWGVKAAVIICTTRFRPRFILKLSGLGPHFLFGRDTAGWSLINFFARQIDPLVIAKVIGTAALGLYAMAYRLMTLPGHLVSGPVQSTIYTRMVAMRDNIPALRGLLLIASRGIASFVFPPMAIICVASTPFIQVFLSDRWLPAAILLSVLAPIGAFQAVTGLNGALLMAVGRTDLRLKLTYEFTLIWVVAAPLLALRSLTAVAVGYAVLYALYAPRMLQLFLRPIATSIATYLGALVIPFVVSCGLVAIYVAINGIGPTLTPWMQIGLAATEVLVGYAVIGWVLRGPLTSDLQTLRALFSAVTPHLAPSRAAGVLQEQES
ncbi:MAG: oligosaccharide flippase family protein [Alphaproteobacteria bacterium]